MKFVLMVEGPAEKILPDFLKRWLNGKLSQPVKIQTVNMGGYGNFKRETTKKAKKHLEGPDYDKIVAVIGLPDLYGINFYPPDKTTVTQRYNWLKEQFETKVNHPKFRLFCAVHEPEAWLFSDPEILPSDVKNFLPAGMKEPEEINFNEPPSKLLKRLYLGHLNIGI